ncbi:MAG TPA: hypothetical protein VK171_13070, partial [Fimbriimonas sp.]|nr:hypothetical protein [Fimbriimonas sp.]
MKLLVSLSLAAMCAMALAGQEVVGKPVTLSQKPLKETTAQVMARHRELEKAGRLYETKREETEHEMEREFLPQNPLSPRAPSWPGISTDSP